MPKLARGRLAVSTTLLLAAALGLAATKSVAAQQAEEAGADTIVYILDPITVTATRTPRPISETPMPVSVISPRILQQRAPNTVIDVFRGLPGLDVTGTGANQVRPLIRGQRGQRILLLENGIRLNNSRRQQDFGGLPALVDVSGLHRVEVVRGPASVLYGTDAIGGVINLITEGPREEGVHGRLNYRYGDAQDQHKGTINLTGAAQGFDFQIVAARRDADLYSAPAGTFGNLTLSDETAVDLTGVEDENYAARLGYRLDDDNRLSFSFERYEATDAGFGFVDPESYDPGASPVRISYPFQNFQKFSLGYQVQGLSTPVVDRFDVTLYRQSNERRLDFDLFAGFGPQAPPGAGIEIQTQNYSDLTTLGFRLEAKKAASQSVLLTYGVDFFEDDSENTDFSRNTVVGFGPPQVTEDHTPNVPNAEYRSVGAFVQSEIDVGETTRIIAGGRVQRVTGESLPTENFTEELADLDDATVVGSLNLLQDVAPGLTAIATVGRAFRAPNLVEMFFEGPTPEGGGFQARNSELKAETSLNFDIGLRYRNARVAAEGFYFRNKVFDGIRIAPRGDTINGLPVSENVNVDELLFQGVELAASARLGVGVSVGGSFTYVESKDELNPDNPIGESFSDKTVGWIRYDDSRDWFWLLLEGRRNGEQKDVALGTSPIGEVLPAFTVLDARGGVRLREPATGLTYQVSLALQNLTDELYAEFSNASFFRPEPGRNLILSVDVIF